MKKYYLFIASLLMTGSAFAQVAEESSEPQEIRSFAIDKHDAIWYNSQADLWKQQTIVSPKNEVAWLNYFKATRYAEMEGEQYDLPRSVAVVEEMENAIPNTYTYYICKFILSREVQESATDYGKLAIENLPKEVGDGEVYTLLGYLWMKGTADDSASTYHKQWLQLLDQQYKKGAYPERVLRYIYNQFQGMESNSLYFANGDMALFPAKLLQDAMGVHKDKQVICISFLSLDEYRNALFSRLGISAFNPAREYDFSKQGEWDAYMKDMVQYIIRATGREAYFFPNQGQVPDIIELLSKYLYNEGLLLHYSSNPYDNLAITKRNVEKRYHLEYLTEPNFGAQEWWTGNERMQLNYVVLLSHMVKHYKSTGDKEHAQWLSYILRMSVMNTPIDDETKNSYLDILKKAEK